MRQLTEKERIAKCREIAAFNGSQAAMLAASGDEVLARAWAVNAATAAFHVLGRDQKHIIVSIDGTGRDAICGQRMPQSKPTGHEFHYRFGEADLRERELPSDVDCSFCRAVAEKVKLGILLSYAIREARPCRTP